MLELMLNKKLHSAGGAMRLDISMDIKQGSFVTLYGKSGAGKTSVLRMIAGLFVPDQGKIIVDDETWLDTQHKINLKPQKRNVGLVFQDYALFPNMTVLENLEFALTKTADRKIIKDLIEVIELGDLQSLKPATLSGGQQQRVALARALVRRPKLLLLDEPLSALDSEMRQKLQEYLLKVHQEFKLTTILVSHDIPEILRLSDYLIQLEKGLIIRQETPARFFAKQASAKLLSVERLEENYNLSILINGQVVQLNIPSIEFEEE